jgi:hypothetical protein
VLRDSIGAQPCGMLRFAVLGGALSVGHERCLTAGPRTKMPRLDTRLSFGRTRHLVRGLIRGVTDSAREVTPFRPTTHETDSRVLRCSVFRRAGNRTPGAGSLVSCRLKRVAAGLVVRKRARTESG